MHSVSLVKLFMMHEDINRVVVLFPRFLSHTHVMYFVRTVIKRAVVEGHREDEVKNIIPMLSEKEWKHILFTLMQTYTTPFVFDGEYEEIRQKLRDWDTLIWEFNHESRRTWWQRLFEGDQKDV